MSPKPKSTKPTKSPRPADTTLAPDRNDLDMLREGRHYNPHSVLGAHDHPDGTVVRALRPNAESVDVRIGGVDHPLTHVENGLFSGLVPVKDLIDYRLVVRYPGGNEVVVADGYRFLPTLGEMDLYLFQEGRHERLWEILGAHPRSYTTPDGEVSGTSFAVWAPNAKGVTVVGDFDGWGGQYAPMRSLGSSGVWELFVTGPRRRARPTSSACTARTARSATTPIRSPSGPKFRRRRRRRSTSRASNGPTTSGSRAAPRPNPARSR